MDTTEQDLYNILTFGCTGVELANMLIEQVNEEELVNEH